MDVFISKIALKEDVTKNEIYSIIKLWLEDSPNYNITVDYNGVDDTYTSQGTTKNGSLKLTIVSTCLDGSEIFACHFENNETNNYWITDCIHIKNDEKNVFSVKLSCKTSSYSNLPKVHKPYLIKLLMENGYCKNDGVFPISDKPIKLTQDQLTCCADMMCGKIETILPVVYISMDIYRPELYAVNADKLAQYLSGLAHVLVEPDFDFSRHLTKATNKRNPINGYIAIYFPNSNYKKTVTVVENGKKIKEQILKEKIYNILNETSLNCAKTTDLNWESLQVQLAKQKYENQKNETNKTSKELDDFLSAYDEETSELKKQIDDLNDKIKQKEEEIETLNSEKYKLQSKIEGIDAQLQKLKNKTDSPLISFVKGNSIEFFADETKEAIIIVLQQCLDKLDKNGRTYTILTEFLENNKLTYCGKAFYSEIKSALKEKSLDARRRSLTKLGFEIDKDDHDKIRYKGLNDYMFTLAGSASDHREPENSYSDIMKKLDIYIKFN